MTMVTIGGRALDAEVIKVRRGAEADALAALRHDGVNNVAVVLGGDTYVASGAGLAVAGLAPGDLAAVGSRAGVVVAIDDEVLRPGTWRRWALYGAAEGAVGLAVVGLLMGAIVGPLAAIELLGLAAAGAAIFGSLAALSGALTPWWDRRQASQDRLRRFAA